ncbi:DUF202 domain-containing protein [Leifsonia sp. NCR5]|uniref:DUF202 domain-containing protein n=1 Tax=Leifsonia sp. NCR5 TaxID=1978342 RepID=UPI000A1944D0|nr:DUF202 domain-containing protein [Leifsonia sp. NCR5]
MTAVGDGVLYDAGLQPERTALAWRRTCLAFLVLSGASIRVLPGQLGVAGYVASALAVVLSAALLAVVHRRYLQHYRQLTGARAGGGAVLAGTAALALALAILGAVSILMGAAS